MRRILKIILPLVGKWKLLTNVLLGIISGLCSFLFINFVTRVINLILTGKLTNISKEYIIIFAAIILLFIWTRRTLSLNIIRLSQVLFWSLRKQVLSLTLRASYQQLLTRKVKINSAIVNDVNILTQTSMNIIDFFTSVIMALSCLLYMASLSFTLFLLTLGVTLLGTVIYHFGTRKNLQDFHKARVLENKFLKSLNAILNGFKEIFMDAKKGQKIYENEFLPVANEAYRNNTAAFTGFLNNQMTGQILFYMLISSILLYFSITLHLKSGDLVSFIFTLLYLLSSIQLVMSLLPALARAGVAANHLMDLKNELEKANLHNTVPDKYLSKAEFEQIGIRDLEFYYGEEQSAFGIGPVKFNIRKGEVIFIYGGNGSGKTTFIHTLLGLCMPSAGEIRLNDRLVENEDYSNYRAVFSVVFSDFYLFDELLGVNEVDTDKWNYYLRLFELEGKVNLEGKHFTTTDLSTGQRKRLALIGALLEEKPVLIMDEWAADQDPYFRKKFYTEILPVLKKQDITIIAITHDDKYYYCADRLYKMDAGELIEESVSIHEPTFIS